MEKDKALFTCPSIFLDTWGWIVLGCRNDPYYFAISKLYSEFRNSKTVIYTSDTSDYVLDELISLLFRREPYPEALNFMNGILSAANLGIIRIERITPERFSSAWELRTKYLDKPAISFTDFTSMSIMKELKITHVLSQDEHFIQVGMGFLRVPFDVE
jgi:predicted nucleic acid-binding protein